MAERSKVRAKRAGPAEGQGGDADQALRYLIDLLTPITQWIGVIEGLLVRLVATPPPPTPPAVQVTLAPKVPVAAPGLAVTAVVPDDQER